jgi:hypothetical protein
MTPAFSWQLSPPAEDMQSLDFPGSQQTPAAGAVLNIAVLSETPQVTLQDVQVILGIVNAFA